LLITSYIFLVFTLYFSSSEAFQPHGVEIPSAAHIIIASLCVCTLVFSLAVSPLQKISFYLLPSRKSTKVPNSDPIYTPRISLFIFQFFAVHTPTHIFSSSNYKKTQPSTWPTSPFPTCVPIQCQWAPPPCSLACTARSSRQIFVTVICATCTNQPNGFALNARRYMNSVQFAPMLDVAGSHAMIAFMRRSSWAGMTDARAAQKPTPNSLVIAAKQPSTATKTARKRIGVVTAGLLARKPKRKPRMPRTKKTRAKYCDKDCQKKDWPHHCNLMCNVADDTAEDTTN
jgi:hypothetical protein